MEASAASSDHTLIAYVMSLLIHTTVPPLGL